MSTTPAFLSNVKDVAIVIQNADGTTFKTVLAGPTSGGRIKSLIATSDDTTARVLQICKTIGAVDYVLGEVSVPVGAGTDGSTPAVNLLEGNNMPGLQTDGLQRFFDLANGTTLKIRSKVAVTAAKTINIVGEYGEL